MRSSLVGLLVALLAGCSSSAPDAPDASDEPSGTPAAAYDAGAVREDLAALFAGDAPRRRDLAAGECFAGRLLETTTPEQLREGGLVAADGGGVTELPALPEALARTVADAQLACIDVVASSTRALASVRKGDLDTRAYGACLRRALPRTAQREALVATLTGEWEDPALERLARTQVQCVEEQRAGR